MAIGKYTMIMEHYGLKQTISMVLNLVMNNFNGPMVTKTNIDTMQDKTPRNANGNPHGYWDVKWINGGWYKGYYINGFEFGLYEIDWKNNGEIDKRYYAR